MTKVEAKGGDPLGSRLGALAVLLYEGERPPARVNEATGGAAQRAVRLGDFRGKAGQQALLYGSGRTPRVMLVGLGPRKGAGAETVRRAVGEAVRLARRLELKSLGVLPPEKPARGLSAADAAGVVAEAAALAAYGWSLKTEEGGKKGGRRPAKGPELKVQVFAEGAAAKAAVRRAAAVAEGTNLARELGNLPGNLGTPTALAQAAQKEGRRAGFKVKVLLPADMKRLGMGGLLGVAKGSAEPPRFVHMEYSPRGAKGPPVVLVGKGLTFDSGGISIKPSDKMWDMKFDKCGGCAVIGALSAVARAKLPLRVVGLVPSTENMPGGRATKPGDVLTALNGKTIEVQNTDAEGRLILADALAYAERLKPAAIVDFATLTGAVMVALGDQRAGVMGTDEGLCEALRKAGEASGERVWPLPLDEGYGDYVKSAVADVKNLGKGRLAGSISGGWFLRHFVPEGVPWAHVDIAGVAWNSSDPGKGYLGQGATGFGVRLAFEFLRARAEA